LRQLPHSEWTRALSAGLAGADGASGASADGDVAVEGVERLVSVVGGVGRVSDAPGAEHASGLAAVLGHAVAVGVLATEVVGGGGTVVPGGTGVAVDVGGIGDDGATERDDGERLEVQDVLELASHRHVLSVQAVPFTASRSQIERPPRPEQTKAAQTAAPRAARAAPTAVHPQGAYLRVVWPRIQGGHAERRRALPARAPELCDSRPLRALPSPLCFGVWCILVPPVIEQPNLIKFVAPSQRPHKNLCQWTSTLVQFYYECVLARAM
jgi:hypothetical protein